MVMHVLLTSQPLHYDQGPASVTEPHRSHYCALEKACIGITNYFLGQIYQEMVDLYLFSFSPQLD
jgi:hypothetical protein